MLIPPALWFIDLLLSPIVSSSLPPYGAWVVIGLHLLLIPLAFKVAYRLRP
jgi:hypothetical protein